MQGAVGIIFGASVPTMLDFNRSDLSAQSLNTQINDLIDKAEPNRERRLYLGASIAGSPCARQVQYAWMCDPNFSVRIRDIFERGQWGESVCRRHLVAAGFKFAPTSELEFTAAEGLFCGHTDGKIIDGPPVPTLRYPCLWECKTLKAKGWKAVERHGLRERYEVYLGQIALYQAYLGCTNPALFTVLNADTCERLHFLVPFDAALAQTLSERVVGIIEATKAGELLPRFTDDPTHWKCRYCDHRERCWRERTD